MRASQDHRLTLEFSICRILPRVSRRIGNTVALREESMLTRRNFVTGAMATGALLRADSVFAKASQPSTPVNFEIPAHACDCHTHYYGDPQKFPLAPQHVNTPEGT